MRLTWTLTAAVMFLAVMIASGSILAAEEMPGMKEAPKAPPQDSAAMLADAAKALDAAKKAADSGDAKAAAAEIAKASDAVAKAQTAIKQTQGEMVAVDNAKCPIMGMAVNKVPQSLTRIHKGRRLGFCCTDCPAMWDRLSDAEKETKFKDCGVKEQKMVKVDNARCPIMGAAVTEVPENNTREYKGKKIGFCCSDCPAAWDRLSDSEKEKKFKDATAPAAEKMTKIDNVKCPIMGMGMKQAAERLTRQHKGKTIGFCCGDCLVAWDKLSDSDKDAKLSEVMPK